MKITITGVSGFVGTNLSAFLSDQGNEVLPVSMREDGWEKILDRQADALIHLAGKAHDTAHVTSEEEYYKINTELTKILFNEFLESDIRDFFYFSSVKAAADTVTGILDEKQRPDPQTAYGKSKRLAEEYLLSQQLPAGKRLFIIRPCMIHGPGNKGNLNLLYKVVSRSIPWPLAAYENSRSFLTIDNLNFLVWQMMQKEVPSGVYHFADDQPVATNKLVKLIGEATGKPVKLWNIPQKLISFAAQSGDFLALPLTTERLKKLTESYVVSNAKIKKVLGIEHLPVAAEDGLLKTLKSFN
ncbi:NAD-dependent epimerase/dehydratase family protein [Kaistella sp. PBT33-4]|uniref:NAD-dependent epimerase/dehydratase family protein n=1 Tax=Kaistella sp. PBT33-4 TaxID=3032000 RepID=UPI0023D845AA|nr:NAD-dependent epimerase/dehydratase family protein [Kaistella sp. PBT33-4]MDF0718817.1 NAD-dependent epimerase/dehydratase family protein [Kaistella sp. PBT33-4]